MREVIDMVIYCRKGKWIAKYEGHTVIAPTFIAAFCTMLEVVHQGRVG